MTAVRGVLIIPLDRLRDAPDIPPGATVRVDLGNARAHQLIGDPLYWLGWHLANAGAIEVIGTDPDAIGYVLRELPGQIEMQQLP